MGETVPNAIAQPLGRMHANVVHFRMVKNPSRRNFLRTAPVAASLSLAGLSLADTPLFAAPAGGGQAAAPVPTDAFQVFTAQAIQDDIKALAAKPGNNNLIGSKTLPFTVVLTTETAKAGKEFEAHEGRDHIFQILEGSTVYEVGGTLQNPRSTGPGEWLAPASAGSTSIALKKGDMLTIPRGTPHRRNTAETVTFFLIAPMGSLKA
jgi:mannose-6-phosphate isomerase-like protein (cupin superfamily)